MKEKMEHKSSKMEHQENEQNLWRRDKVLQLSSQGYSQREIAEILHLSVWTINRDLSFLRQQSKENIKKYVDERLLEEYEKCLIGVNSILKEAWMTAQNAQNERDKIQALNLAKECYSMRMDMLTNATVIDDAIRFINVNTSEKTKEKAKAHNAGIEDIDDISGPSQKGITEPAAATTNKTF